MANGFKYKFARKLPGITYMTCAHYIRGAKCPVRGVFYKDDNLFFRMAGQEHVCGEDSNPSRNESIRVLPPEEAIENALVKRNRDDLVC